MTVTNTGEGAAAPTVTLDLHSATDPGTQLSFHTRTGILPRSTSESINLRVTTSQWFEPLGEYEITVHQDGYRSDPLTFKVVAPEIEVPRFREVSAAKGIVSVNGASSSCGDHSLGAAWGDIDGDKDLDLFTPGGSGSSQVWVNENGTFTDEAAERGLNATGAMSLAATLVDHDNDGDPDLYVINSGANRLYLNDGSGHFTDTTEAAGVGDPGPGSSASWGDYDEDGNLDLYVANWGTCDAEEKDLTYAPDVLYKNNGDGTFTDVTHLLSASASMTGAGFQAAWLDYDRDGDQDLYLGNDFIGSAPVGNILWRNDGPEESGGWSFTNVSVASHTNLTIATMGLAIGDYDRDLDLDIGMSNIESAKLLRNRGDGTFAERGARARIARPLQRTGQKSVTWGTAFSDLNNDGWEDLYFAGGRIPNSHPAAQVDAVFANAGNGKFFDLTAVSGASNLNTSRGIALADFDRDGRMDIYVANQEGTGDLFRNKTPKRSAHWLEVDTVGRKSNKDSCGAILIATLPDRAKLMRQVFCGSVGLGSSSDPTVHLGLADHDKVRRLRITWPSGLKRTVRNVTANQLVTIREPRVR